MLGVDRRHLALAGPALDHRGATAGPLPQGGFEIILDHRRAVHHFAGPDLAAGRVAARDFHLGVDIGPDAFDRAGGGVETVGGVQPDLEDVLDHRAVKLFLGGKIVVQVGLGQPRHVGDKLHRRPAEPGLGKHLFGGRQDGCDILLPDFRAPSGLQAGNLGGRCHGAPVAQIFVDRLVRLCSLDLTIWSEIESLQGAPETHGERRGDGTGVGHEFAS